MKQSRISFRPSPAFVKIGRVARSCRLFALRGVLLRLAGLAAVGLWSSLAFCAKKVESGVKPIQAELMADLNARLLSVGAPVYARVIVDWSGPECVLRKGAVVEAHVVSVVSYNRSTKLSQLELVFTRAQCAAPEMAALDLLLAAMAAPPRPSDLGILSDPLPINTSGRDGLATLGAMQLSANVDYKLQLDSSSYDYPALPTMHMGDVSGIHGLKLSVGAGTGNSAVLTSKGHDVSLDKHTLLLLVPAEGTYPRPASETVQPTAASSPVIPVAVATAVPEHDLPPPSVPLPEEVADDIDICNSVHCNVALVPASEIDAGKPEVSFLARQIGYAPRPRQEMSEFDHDEALAWLGPGQLLVAFNPHGLITRRRLGPLGSTQRMIRAVLLDTNARSVTRAADWELTDNAVYLWPLADNRVLVHVGSELRVYGEGMKITNRLALDGPLGFLRVTPDGNFIVVGQVRERHSPELHAQLRESLHADPEEDVAISVLNRNFETIAKSTALSNLLPPTLLNEGQVRLLALPNQRYSIALHTWNDRTSVLANFGSTCAPQLSSLAPDLLFLASCKSVNGLLEYRILDSNGKLILKSFSNPDDLIDTAKGIANPGTFVVKTIRSNNVSLGEPFSASSLDSEQFGVFRAADGKRLFAVRIGSPSPSLDGYAIACDGSALAVLTRDQVSIFSISQK